MEKAYLPRGSRPSVAATVLPVVMYTLKHQECDAKHTGLRTKQRGWHLSLVHLIPSHHMFASHPWTTGVSTLRGFSMGHRLTTSPTPMPSDNKSLPQFCLLIRQLNTLASVCHMAGQLKTPSPSSPLHPIQSCDYVLANEV